MQYMNFAEIIYCNLDSFYPDLSIIRYTDFTILLQFTSRDNVPYGLTPFGRNVEQAKVLHPLMQCKEMFVGDAVCAPAGLPCIDLPT